MTGLAQLSYNDSASVAKRPQTMGYGGSLLELGMIEQNVCCDSLGGLLCCWSVVRTWSRLEKTHKNRLDCTQ